MSSKKTNSQKTNRKKIKEIFWEKKAKLKSNKISVKEIRGLENYFKRFTVQIKQS